MSTTTITSAEFLVALDATADHRLRHIPVPPVWKPGTVVVPLQWDRLDDAGHAVGPGHYRLSVDIIINQRLPATCGDGSGQGVEKHDGTLITGVVGYLDVP